MYGIMSSKVAGIKELAASMKQVEVEIMNLAGGHDDMEAGNNVDCDPTIMSRMLMDLLLDSNAGGEGSLGAPDLEFVFSEFDSDDYL